MASSKGANKGAEKAKNGAIAGRLAHLRSRRFELEGFASNAPIPSLSEARRMAGRNRAKLSGSVVGEIQVPSVRQR